jgi:hypothetical protein
MKALPLSLPLCALLTEAIGCKKVAVSPSWVLLSSTPTVRAEIDTKSIVQPGECYRCYLEEGNLRRAAWIRTTYGVGACRRPVA